VADVLTVQSHKGPYRVLFSEAVAPMLSSPPESRQHFLVDARIAQLYADALKPVLAHRNTVLIDATEENKSLERIIPVIERLVENRIRRDHVLVAVGGGIVQDITCFIASTLLRGVPWNFVPTTLLAQADSCIGSKSSINLGPAKNILGTFNPPREVQVCSDFLDTLEPKDIRSGIGEILKVHAIDGPASFDRVARDYRKLVDDRRVLQRYIRAALLIKQPFVEADEFDRGIRNIFNYGHSFGHAIESATNFVVPHGIAVSMGVDMANHIAVARGLLPDAAFRRMHPVLRENYAMFAEIRIPVEAMLAALTKDKKNTATRLVLIFPVGEETKVQRVEVEPDAAFRSQCEEYLAGLRA
jgi:3-dehydroquinate synthase